MTLVRTAGSHHGSCFICGRTTRLQVVREESMLRAYAEHKIYIKHHARLCKSHTNNNGLLNEEVFQLIPTRLRPIDSNLYMLLNGLGKYFSSSQTCPQLLFDRFEDITNLSEEDCKEATGWSKDIFVRFSAYITSVYETDGRSKEQLIAIYRYWLRKGLTCDSLAKLKSNTTRRQINKYLTQIRKAIYRDFVPWFLGARSRSREFFLKHNNETTKELHNMSDDELAVVIDGTYARIEKSANNQFQYDSYSGQKLASLLKPFIICCTDGYFIDCYGPFRANMNDASILEYILETEKDLLEILQPNKTTLFLDRGFRDIYERLKTAPYNFNPKMPYCPQIHSKKKVNTVQDSDSLVENGDARAKNKKQKQLTTEQANQSRLVTKV